MPVILSNYVAPVWLRGGHGQTVLPVFLRRTFAGWQARERLELEDGDFVDLSWIRGVGSARLAILSHGLEGSVEAVYMRGLAGTLVRAGWDVVGWNYRGCGGVENRLMRSYHSGEAGDLRAVAAHVAPRYDWVSLVGFSLGGNISLKCAAEGGLPPAVRAAVAVSAPVDLASSARQLDEEPSNRVYKRRFLKTLIKKTLSKAERFPELGHRLAGADGGAGVVTIREFDERITAPVHGFADAADYWARASARPLLSRLTMPSLLLSARNDPLLDEASFPEEEARVSRFFYLEAPRHGGHVGFLDFRRGLQPWHERRVLEFLESVSWSKPGNA
jgi:predicted alpha/beta-fold hydrolase